LFHQSIIVPVRKSNGIGYYRANKFLPLSRRFLKRFYDMIFISCDGMWSRIQSVLTSLIYLEESEFFLKPNVKHSFVSESINYMFSPPFASSLSMKFVKDSFEILNEGVT